MVQLTNVTEPDRWDAFVCAHPCGHFLQTWAWGALKEKFGWQPARVALCDGEQLVAGVQILFRKFPLGAMGYIPKGPVIAPDSPLWPDWLDAMQQVARKHNAFFIRMEPEWESAQIPKPNIQDPNPSLQSLVSNPAAAIQPLSTIHIDLRPPPDAVLAQMKQKWRYNIRLAERKGIQVRIGGESDLSEFYRLSQITAQRDQFAIHSEEYYRTAWRLFSANNSVALFVAEFNGKAIAAIFVVACGSMAIYLYGASSDEERNRMPNHLLQWRAMLWAKERGCEVYDLWGIPTPNDAINEGEIRGDKGDKGNDLSSSLVHPVPRASARYAGERLRHRTSRHSSLPNGLLKFKEGFGGRVVQYAGAFDVVYNPLMYRALDFLIAKRRGLT